MTIFGIEWSLYLGAVASGILRTVEFTAVSYIGAIGLGAVVAIGRTQRVAVLRRVAGAYVEIIKNVPLLTWIFVLYFGLPSVGIRLPGFVAGCLALIFFYGSYIGEVFRGGLQGVGPGQHEAAQSMGLTGWQAYRYIILPQALRLALAGTGTMLVDLIKATSLLVTIAGGELMTQGQEITSDTFKALQVYLVIGLLYFLLCYPTSQSVLWLERRLAQGRPLSLKRRRWLALAHSDRAVES